MSQQFSEDSSKLWHNLVEANKAYSLAFRAFCAKGVEHVPWIKQGLRAGGAERMSALTVFPYLSAPEQLELFGDLVFFARAVHGPVEAIWKLILSLPREWVLSHIEEEVNRILDSEEEDDYWMFLQLYEQLDRDLTLKMARRAAAHSQPGIREMGEEYLDRLLQPQMNADQP